jgi:hypothetical protein
MLCDHLHHGLPTAPRTRNESSRWRMDPPPLARPVEMNRSERLALQILWRTNVKLRNKIVLSLERWRGKLDPQIRSVTCKIKWLLGRSNQKPKNKISCDPRLPPDPQSVQASKGRLRKMTCGMGFHARSWRSIPESIHHLTQRVHWFSETAQSSMTASVQCVGINQRYTMLYLLIKGVYCDFKEGKVMHMEVPTALPPNTNHLWGPKQIPPRDVPIGHHSDLPRHNPCHTPSQLWPL